MVTDILIALDLTVTVALALWIVRPPKFVEPPIPPEAPVTAIPVQAVAPEPSPPPALVAPMPYGTHRVVRHYAGRDSFVYPRVWGQDSGKEAASAFLSYTPTLPGERVQYIVVEHGRDVERGRKECSG